MGDPLCLIPKPQPVTLRPHNKLYVISIVLCIVILYSPPHTYTHTLRTHTRIYRQIHNTYNFVELSYENKPTHIELLYHNRVYIMLLLTPK